MAKQPQAHTDHHEKQNGHIHKRGKPGRQQQRQKQQTVENTDQKGEKDGRLQAQPDSKAAAGY